MAQKVSDRAKAKDLSRRVVTLKLKRSDHSLLSRRRFHTVFIDEAAQALEPACWIPLLRADRVI